ncbi:MAG TPA: alpha/beta fold hydrolase [Pirellulaceae bacterium]
MVFVHGNPTWLFHWRRLLARFRHTHRVIAVDHLGSGLSDRPRGYLYSLADHSRNLAHFLDGLGLSSVTLVAQDWGGAIGLHCGLMERPGTLERVVLFNTGAFPPSRVPKRIAICTWPWLGPFLIQGCNAFPQAALRMALVRPQRLSPTERDGILAPYRSWRAREGILGFLRDIPRSMRHPTWRHLEHLEANLTKLRNCPIACIWGMRDWCFDEPCLERLHAHLPHAEVTRVEEAGHWVVEDAPDVCERALEDFLRRHPVACKGRPADRTGPNPIDALSPRTSPLEKLR